MTNHRHSTAKSLRGSRRLMLLGVLVAGLGTWAGVALAAPSPSAPTISAHPATLTNSTSASFTYTDSASVTRFECQLDASGYGACGTSRPSTKSYADLAAGPHTFYVRAVTTSGTSSSTAYSWTIDRTPPTVSSIVRVGASPTNVASVQWTVTFSEPVTGVAASDFSLISSGFSAAPAITAVTGSGTTYTVSATTDGSTTTDSASEALRVSSAGSIADLAGNGLTGAPVTGQAYTVDKHAPTVVSITRAGSNPTNAGPLQWTVTFSGPVKNVAPADFGIARANVNGTPAVTTATPAGGGPPQRSWTVSVSTAGVSGQNNGSIQLDLAAKGAIQDALGNALAGSVPVAGQAYNYDTTAPPAPLFLFAPPAISDSTLALFVFADMETDTTIRCSLDGGAFAPCTLAVLLTGVSQGVHSFRLQAVDPAGNVSGVTTWGWYVDTVAPAVAFTQTPHNPDTSTSPTFKFTASDGAGSGVASVQCRLDSGQWQTCTSPRTLSNLATGSHTFSIRATDNAGNVSSVVSYTWTISTATLPVTITGNGSATVNPGGASVPVPVTFTNPNPALVSVTSLAMSIVPSSLPANCLASDFAINAGNISAGNPLTVPANSSVTLPSGGVSEPSVTMADTHVRQDACAGATLTLSYGGSNAGTIKIGSTTPFTIALGAPTGGSLSPGGAADTVGVTVTNTDGAAENLHQLVFEVTPGWSASLAGHPDCTAADFSVNGGVAGAATTITVDQDLAPHGQATTSFTLKMIDANHDQDACAGATVGLTVNAS